MCRLFLGVSVIGRERSGIVTGCAVGHILCREVVGLAERWARVCTVKGRTSLARSLRQSQCSRWHRSRQRRDAFLAFVVLREIVSMGS